MFNVNLINCMYLIFLVRIVPCAKSANISNFVAIVYRYINSKIRRSRTYLERRKNLASNRPLEHTVSSKEVSIITYALEHRVTEEKFPFYMLDWVRFNFWFVSLEIEVEPSASLLSLFYMVSNSSCGCVNLFHFVPEKVLLVDTPFLG